MNQRETQHSRLRAGEARIRRAFIGSALMLGVLALLAAAVWWLSTWESGVPAPMDVVVTGPESSLAPTRIEPPAVHFSDITVAAGIDFVHVNGAYGERLMPETIGAGAAFIDYDNDGHPDIFLVNSRYWDGHAGEGDPRMALYRNNGDGSFTDVSRAAGVDLSLYGMGVAVGDFDNDGWDDLFITTLGKNVLLRNDHGRFVDVTRDAGVAGRDVDWSTAATFIDYDNDGDLDLAVINYVKWSREIDLEINFRLTGLGRAYGAPTHFVGTQNQLYRNEGNGRFTNVSQESGIEVVDPQSGQPVGKGLGVVAVDFDSDGWTDLIVANDTVRNFLYRNLGDGRFEDVGAFEGIAYDREGKSTSGMGIDAAWFRNDADLGVAVGNFANEMTSLYVTSGGRGPFVDEAMLEGIGPASRLALTFGVLFFDYDLDGWLDFLQANGHLEHEINKVQPSQHYEQPPQLFWNCPQCPQRFVAAPALGALATPLVGRGVAYADIDGDGDLDVLITQTGRRSVLLRNDQTTGHHFLRVALRGTRANRNGLGARVELTAGGVTQRREVSPTRGYLTQSERTLTFGLGPQAQVERLRVVWPGGEEQIVSVDRVNTTLVVEQSGGG
ncbi:MAG: CRTAC1 family protein [Thiotrichales bacterium]